LIHFTVLEGTDTIIQDNPSIYTVKAFCLCLQVYSQKTWGSCGAKKVLAPSKCPSKWLIK
jgi:hypothetical protein